MAAQEFPRQSYEDIAKNGTSNGGYENMEAGILEANDPSAEERRNEMERWANAVGAYASKASEYIRKVENDSITKGAIAKEGYTLGAGVKIYPNNMPRTPLGRVSRTISTGDGLRVRASMSPKGEDPTPGGVRIAPVNGGMMVRPLLNPEDGVLRRSPAQIAADNNLSKVA